MKVITLQRNGDLQLQEMDVPRPSAAGDVLIRLVAAGINPIDLKIRDNPEAFPVSSPFIPGCDGAGTVEAVGSGVERLAPGDEVYYCQPGFNGRMGSYAEYVIVDQSLIAKKPAAISFHEAAAAPLVLITAWEALFDRISLTAGQTVFIPAGAGGVGHVAIQIARSVGAEVCTTVSSEEKARLAKHLGADRVLLYPRLNVVDQVLDWSGGEGVDVSLDTVGKNVFSECAACTRTGGDVVTILQPPADFGWSAARLKNLGIHLELMLTSTWINHAGLMHRQGKILEKCAAMITQGNLQIIVAESLPLEQAAEAHKILAEQRPAGKITLEMPG